MRGLGFFLGGIARRNDPVKLTPGNPPERHYRLETGNAGLDGYTVLSTADPEQAGRMGPIPGTEGYAYQGPDQSFEQ